MTTNTQSTGGSAYRTGLDVEHEAEQFADSFDNVSVGFARDVNDGREPCFQLDIDGASVPEKLLGCAAGRGFWVSDIQYRDAPIDETSVTFKPE